MVQCPHCKTEVHSPSKSWPVHFGKKQQDCTHQLVIGIFECPQCKTKFRSGLRTNTQHVESPNIGELVDRIKSIREGFVQSLSTLREKINTLEKERSVLLAEAEELREVAQSRADALQSEVSQLRQEIKALKELLDSTGTE